MPVPSEEDFSNFLEFGMDFTQLNEHGQPIQHRPLPEHVPTSTADGELVEMQTEQTGQPPQQQQQQQQQQQYTRMIAGLGVNLQAHSRAQSQDSNQPQNQHQDHSQGQDQGQVLQSYGNADVSPGFYPHEHSQRNQQQQQQQQHPPFHRKPTTQPYGYGHPIIPPTPNSIELHGSAARFQPRPEEGGDMYDQYSRMNEEQVSTASVTQHTPPSF